MTQRVALVTGALGGLGTAIAQQLALAGHKVVAAYHPEFDKPDEWVKEQEAAGFKDFILVAGDVSDLASSAAMVAEAEAKAGVIGFSKALAAELATKGVTVNVIAPGYVATKMVTAIREDILKTIVDSVPMKRLAKPEEIGFAVAFLANDLSGFTTGATLNVNGGLYYQ